jgi:hypothetical protein
LDENRGLVIADESFRRDEEAFELEDQAERENLDRFKREFTQVVHAQFASLQTIQVFRVVRADWEEPAEEPVAPPEPSDELEPQDTAFAEVAAEEEPQRQRVNPVTQIDSSDLLTSHLNPHLLGLAWNNFNDHPLTSSLISDLPPLVSCTAITPIVQTVEG